MLIVSQLVRRDDCADELRHLKLWNMRADAVRRVHLSVFFQLGKHLTNHEVAKNCTNHILSQLQQAHLNCVIRNEHLTDYQGISEPFFSFDLKRGLASMDDMSRRCVYFSLLSELPLKKAVTLTWGKLKRLKATGQYRHLDAAWDVIDATPHHFQTPLVFWRYENGEVCALDFIEEDVRLAFGMEFSALKQHFASMILFDQGQEAQALLRRWR